MSIGNSLTASPSQNGLEQMSVAAHGGGEERQQGGRLWTASTAAEEVCAPAATGLLLGRPMKARRPASAMAGGATNPPFAAAPSFGASSCGDASASGCEIKCEEVFYGQLPAFGSNCGVGPAAAATNPDYKALYQEAALESTVLRLKLSYFATEWRRMLTEQSDVQQAIGSLQGLLDAIAAGGGAGNDTDSDSMDADGSDDDCGWTDQEDDSSSICSGPR